MGPIQIKSLINNKMNFMIILLICLKLSGGTFIKEEETSHRFIEVYTIGSKLSSIFHLYLAVEFNSNAWLVALKQLKTPRSTT